MKSYTQSQKSLKAQIFSPILKKRQPNKTSLSPVPLKSLKSVKRSQSIPRNSLSTISMKEKNFSQSLPQPKKLNSLDAWKLANGINLRTKVFIIQGSYPELKQSLLDKGWVENKDSTSGNFDLLWARTGKFPNNLMDSQVINHFPNNVEISAKWNLCENVRKLKTLLNVDPNTFFPRCFRIFGKEVNDLEDFFKVIKASSVLKQFIDSNAGCYEKVATAIVVCRRWLNCSGSGSLRAGSAPFITGSEWKIISSTSLLDIQVEFKRHFAGRSVALPHEIKSKSTLVLEDLERHDPQFHMNGTKSIWIVKPGRKSRGRDIAIFDNLEAIKKYTQNPQKWIVQKYIENPMLIDRKKFDIRQWVLVTNTDPLIVWIYNSCYLRFTVENYDISNIDNLFMHLTNNSISKNSKKFKASDIEGCMWHVREFKDYLISNFSEDIWSTKLFPQIKNIVHWSLRSVGSLGRKNSFEVLGYDFMVDTDFKVWLIEVNSSPAMDYSTVIFI